MDFMESPLHCVTWLRVVAVSPVGTGIRFPDPSQSAIHECDTLIILMVISSILISYSEKLGLSLGLVQKLIHKHLLKPTTHRNSHFLRAKCRNSTSERGKPITLDTFTTNHPDNSSFTSRLPSHLGKRPANAKTWRLKPRRRSGKFLPTKTNQARPQDKGQISVVDTRREKRPGPGEIPRRHSKMDVGAASARELATRSRANARRWRSMATRHTMCEKFSRRKNKGAGDSRLSVEAALEDAGVLEHHCLGIYLCAREERESGSAESALAKRAATMRERCTSRGIDISSPGREQWEQPASLDFGSPAAALARALCPRPSGPSGAPTHLRTRRPVPGFAEDRPLQLSKRRQDNLLGIFLRLLVG